MSRSSLILLMVVCLCVSVAALPPTEDFNGASGIDDAANVDNTRYIAANSILMFVTNHGNFGRDLSDELGHDYGTYFPFTSIADITSGVNVTSPLYAGGLWLGGKVNGSIRVAVAEYSDEYVPGPMSGGTYLPDNPAYHVYRLYVDSMAGNPNSDYLAWPVDQGAPVDGGGNPLLRGDQHLWSVFNDADPDQHTNDAGETDPLGVEVRQSVWASNTSGEEAVVHMQYDLYNKGGNTIDSFFISIWLDPDIGGAGDDYVGCDSANQMIFCYNADNDDEDYGTAPAALAVLFEQGPVVVSPGDTAWYNNSPVPGYRNAELYCFNKYINGTDPNDYVETYNYMRGLRNDGSPWIDPTTAEVTRFAVRGDPIAGTGWIDSDPSDRRMMASYGPFTFAPGDSQQVRFRFACGQDGERISSLIEAKNILEFGSGGETPDAVSADNAGFEVQNHGRYQDVWFSPPSERWLTGRDGYPLYGGEDALMGFETTLYGSSVNPFANPELFTTVELRFSETETQMAYRFCVDYTTDEYFDYCGYFEVPFTVWDTENDRQLNVLFYELADAPDFYDESWMPPAFGNTDAREYLYIVASDYSGDDPMNSDYDYTSAYLRSGEVDILYVLRPAIETGHSFDELADGQKLVFQSQTFNPNGPSDTVFFRTVAPAEPTWQELHIVAQSAGLSTVEVSLSGDNAFVVPLEREHFTYELDRAFEVQFQPDNLGIYSATLTVTDSISGAVLGEVVLFGRASNPPLGGSVVVEPDHLLPLPREEIVITIGELEGGYTVDDIDQSSVLINGVALDAEMAIVPSRPDPSSHMLQLSLRALGLLQTYEPIEGEVVRDIEATFWTTDGQGFVADGQFTLVGIIAGDVDGDRSVDLSDLIYMVNYLFLGGPEPVSMEAANVACDAERAVDLSDLIKMVQTLFLGGDALAPCR